MILTMLSCSSDTINLTECSTPATVRDLTKLDGCGYGFQLNDSSVIIPSWPVLFCGTPPLPKEITEDPLYNFQWEDGKKVYINYTLTDSVANICMIGKAAKIDCIQEANPLNTCIEEKIKSIKEEEPRNPPAIVYQYTYHGNKVYFIPQYCCDAFSILLDEDCNVICAPDGGIAAGGDGKCKDFFENRKNEKIIWKDERSYSN